MDKLKFKYETLFTFKNKKVKFNQTIFLFNDNFLDKSFFIYPIFYKEPKYFLDNKKKHELQLQQFMEIIALCNYIFTKNKIKLPKIKESTCVKVEKICNINTTYSQDFYSDIYYNNLNTFNDLEFFSFVFFLTYLLKKGGYKQKDYYKTDTKEENLKERLIDVLTQLNYKVSNFEIDRLFKKKKKCRCFYTFLWSFRKWTT